MFWQRMCRLATQCRCPRERGGQPQGTSGRVLLARGAMAWNPKPVWFTSLHFGYASSVNPWQPFAFRYPEIPVPLSGHLPQDARTGQPCPGEILEPVRWPPASGFEPLLQSPSTGTQKEKLLPLQGHRIPSQGDVFHSTKHPSSCTTQGSGPSTVAGGGLGKLRDIQRRRTGQAQRQGLLCSGQE